MKYILKPEEEVIMSVQQYWIPFLPRMLFFAIWFVLPFYFMYSLFRQGQWGVWVFVVAILTAVFFGFRSWYIWSGTVFTVTSKRLIDIDQQGLFSRVSSSVMLNKVDDVSFSKKGIIQTVFGYGTVKIVTSGNADDVLIRRVKNPQKLNDLVHDLCLKKSAKRFRAKELEDY